MSEKTEKFRTVKRVTQYALLSIMLMTVLFIFYNSTLPPEKSQGQSDTIKDVIIEVLPDNSPSENFVEEYIRKIAHFSEYGLLGVEVAIYLIFFERRRLAFSPIALLLPLLVGFIDESIQSLSDRGPTIADVWIDIGGFATFFLLTFAVFGAAVLVIIVVKKVRGKKEIITDTE